MERILIIEDETPMRTALADLLAGEGYRALTAVDGESGLQRALAEKPDLVLLDITMPGMDGYEVCARMKANEKLKDIPVIFISALHETLDKVKGFSVGGLDYVTKPFQFEEVHARVETHLGSSPNQLSQNEA